MLALVRLELRFITSTGRPSCVSLVCLPRLASFIPFANVSHRGLRAIFVARALPFRIYRRVPIDLATISISFLSTISSILRTLSISSSHQILDDKDLINILLVLGLRVRQSLITRSLDRSTCPAATNEPYVILFPNLLHIELFHT
jgi:hypothetical protein